MRAHGSCFLFGLVITWLSISHPILAQSPTSDSLLTVHLDNRLPDTVRLKALLSLGFTNYRYDSLLYFQNQFEQVVKAKGTPVDLIEFNLQKGGAHIRMDQFEEALTCFERAEMKAAEIRDTMRLLRAIGWQGNYYGSINQTNLSIEKYLEAKVLAEQIGNQRFVSIAQGNIGVQFEYQGDYEKAEEYYQEDLIANREMGDTLGWSRRLHTLGNIYIEKGELARALEYFGKAEAMAEDKQYIYLLALIRLRKGICHLELGDLRIAEDYFIRARDLAEQTNQPSIIAGSQLGLARLRKYTNPDEAIQLAKSALLIEQELKNLHEQANVYELLSEVYEAKGEFESALAMQKEWIALNDSIFSDKNQRAIYQIEAQYEYEKKKLEDQLVYEQEIAEQKLGAQRRFSLLIGCFVLCVIVFLVLFWYRQIRSEQERRSFLHEIELLRERVAVQSVTNADTREELTLNKAKLEDYLGGNLGDSSWMILNILFEDPSVTNKAIAEKVHLSLEGVSSSLRRMYKAFDVSSESNRNKKVALITKVVQISLA